MIIETGRLTSIYIDGFDLSDAGLVVERTEGLYDSPEIQQESFLAPGRSGHMGAGVLTSQPRVVSLSGVVRAESFAALRSDLDRLRQVLDAGLLEVLFVDDVRRIMLARRAAFRPTPLRPQKASNAARYELELVSDDPLLHEVSDRVYQLTSARTPIRLGGAWSAPVIRANGPGDDPVAIARSITGAQIGKVGYDVTLAADEFIETNCQAQTSLLYKVGVVPAPIAMTDDSDYFTLHPSQGRPAENAWPTIEQNLEGEVQVRRTW